MRAIVCDRCHAVGKFVQAKWQLPVTDKIEGKAQGDLCDEHLKEATAKFSPGRVRAYAEWLAGTEKRQEMAAE